MSSVFIVAHHERSDAAVLARAAVSWLHERGHDAWMSLVDAEALSVNDLGRDRSPSEADLALCLGGDGTMLRTIKSLKGAPVPVIGVNVGVLGYLTEIEPPALLTALERWFASDENAGDWHIEERMMLQISVTRMGADSEDERWRALNEVVLEKGESGHTVHLLVSIDGAVFTSYAADGLIVATPTGSTAYSLSARGPVVSPQHRAMLLTPVSPHMLFDRSLVLDPEEELRFTVTDAGGALMTVDGRELGHLDERDVVTCTAGPKSARVVTIGPRDFHQILKAKFGLSDR